MPARFRNSSGDWTYPVAQIVVGFALFPGVRGVLGAWSAVRGFAALVHRGEDEARNER
jgi:hypothetical protein